MTPQLAIPHLEVIRGANISEEELQTFWTTQLGKVGISHALLSTRLQLYFGKGNGKLIVPTPDVTAHTMAQALVADCRGAATADVLTDHCLTLPTFPLNTNGLVTLELLPDYFSARLTQAPITKPQLSLAS